MTTRMFTDRTLSPIITLRHVCDNIARGTLDDDIKVDHIAQTSAEVYLLMTTFQSFIIALRIGSNAYYGTDLNKVIFSFFRSSFLYC
jgi:nitrogen fixation/metabolism regulation signal transduction histidine kinase